MDDSGEYLCKEFNQIQSTRGTWESHWQDIADLILPRAREFTTRRHQNGSKRTELMYDSTAGLALERFASAMESMLTPRAQKWHNLSSTNPDLNKDPKVKSWFDDVTRIVFAERYSSKANFASQYHENYMQLGAFGNGSVFVDENEGGGLRYRAVHLGELYFAENHQGIIDTVYRHFEMTAHAARSNPDWVGSLPEKITSAKNPYQTFDFLHVVKPRTDRDPERKDSMGMPWSSVYICLESKQKISEGGYENMPYAISRYVTGPRETYGRSPASFVLADIKVLNEMAKDELNYSRMSLYPPMLMHDDGVLGGGEVEINLSPGSLIYGGINAEGRQLIQPYNAGVNLHMAEEKMERKRRTINDAFLVTLFQVLVDSPSMTATEALMRAQEKAALMGPAMGRQQSESLGPMIERELSILQRQGKLPQMPGVLIEASGDYEIMYDSPINKMQRSEEVSGISRLLELIAPFAQFDPSVMNAFNPYEIARVGAEVFGVPQKVMRTPEELEEIARVTQEQQAANDAAQQMAPAATALKDVAQAQALLRETAA